MATKIQAATWHKVQPNRGKFVPHIETGCNAAGWHYRLHMVSDVTDVVTSWHGTFDSEPEAAAAGLNAFGRAVRNLDGQAVVVKFQESYI